MVGNLANALAEDLRIQIARSTGARRNSWRRPTARSSRRKKRCGDRDRLAALGQLSAGLAHELRNPLGTIKASAEMLDQQLSAENEVAREVAGFISTEVDRTNSLITRFLQFARPLKLHLETADLAQTLDRAVAQAEREAPGDRDLQELRAGDSAVSLRCGADGAGVLQPGAERRAGHRRGRRGDGEDARRRAAWRRSP